MQGVLQNFLKKIKVLKDGSNSGLPAAPSQPFASMATGQVDALFRLQQKSRTCGS